MLAAIGLVTILVLLAVILFRKMSPLVALIAIPALGALCAGAGWLKTGGYMVDGLKSIAPVRCSELRCDLIGVDAIHGAALSARAGEPHEVRVRVAGRTASMREAVRIGNEVESLYTNGPASGGGAWKSARQVVAIGSTLIPRALVSHSVTCVEV